MIEQQESFSFTYEMLRIIIAHLLLRTRYYGR